MLTNIVLCISAKQATAGVWRLGSLVACNQYANDEAGLAKFKLFISARRNVPVHIIVDAVEEDYRIETIPHTSGKTHADLVQRRLLQVYRSAPYRSALFLEREKDKRRDDRILLMALTNAELLAPWLAILEGLETPLAGAYLAPMVSQLLAKALKLKQPNLLLMTHQPSGLRQTYIANQSPRLSRLNPSGVNSNGHLDSLYLSETEKTRLYLVSLRMITRETPIHLVYPATRELQFDLAAELEEQQGVSAEVIPLTTLAKTLGLKAELLSRHPDLLLMHVLARGRMAANLLTEREVKRYRLLQFAWGLNSASITAVALGLWFALSSLFNMFSYKLETRVAQEQTLIHENRYRAVSASFPPTPVSGNELKTAVELANKLDHLGKTPDRLMRVVSQELEKQPELTLNRMRWKQTEDAKVTDDLPGGSRAVSVPSPDTPPPRPADGLYEVGFVDGEIRNFRGDYRAALESVATFADNLKKNTEVAQVKMIVQPVNTSSRSSLQGSTLDQQAQQQETALFQIRVFLKPETPRIVPVGQGATP